MNVYVGSVPGTCGVGVVFGFNSNDNDINRYGRPISGIPARNAGFELAGFIDTPKCKAVYKELSEKWKTVYQSPVRRNRNTGNKFFFVIYDTEAKEN